VLASCGRVGVKLLPQPETDSGKPFVDSGVSPPDASVDAGDGSTPDTGPGPAADAEIDAGIDSGVDSGCPTTCANDHGTAECSTGSCQLSCEIGYADCDGAQDNGCETSTMSELSSCGGCDLACTTSQGSTACSQGLCMPSCVPGMYGDCDGNARNGCETALTTDQQSCGSCGTACTNPNGTTSCVAGTCAPVCAAGYADCDGNPTNGCEVRTESDPSNCGGCGLTCDTSFQVCANQACEVSMCPLGQGDCDANQADCETDLTDTVADCGFCNNVCTAANGTASCTSSTCGIASCSSGFANCDANVVNGCEVALASNLANCGSCGMACANAHGSTRCMGGSCAPVCSSGWGTCDGNSRNGCETALNTVTNCGNCGNVCPNAMAGATAVCNSGVCGYTCNTLSGVYALRINTQVSWSSTPFVRSGNGTANFWLRLTLTQSGTALTGSAMVCDQATPPTSNSATSDRYLLDYPAAMFTPGAPAAAFSATLASQAPGAGLTSTRTAHVLGVSLSDPLNGAWPSLSTARSNQVDHDSDTEVGITVVFVDDSTYNHAQTAGSLFAARASHAYGAQRLRFSLGGALTGCSGGAGGTATVQSFDTKTIGCRLESGSDCSSSQYTHLDNNSVVYNTGASNYTMTRLGGAGSTFSCAQVRAAL
jgi:hypothetical protein